MKKIGLLSDTHGHLPGQIFEIFSGVDFIIHAGDIGGQEILSDLAALAPVKAVYGNMDSYPLHSTLSRIDFINVENITLCVTHIMNSYKSFSYELFKMNRSADVVVFGHTHRVDKTKYKNILFVNPGSVSYPRGGGKPSVALMTIDDTDIEVDFYELKK